LATLAVEFDTAGDKLEVLFVLLKPHISGHQTKTKSEPIKRLIADPKYLFVCLLVA
jgi:hypothetical protein